MEKVGGREGDGCSRPGWLRNAVLNELGRMRGSTCRRCSPDPILHLALTRGESCLLSTQTGYGKPITCLSSPVSSSDGSGRSTV
ncbi:hypothetical protein J4Q44_G00165100 [Coregonus suidteri]|uniref:Uncharacterized protein n=1 Tax=Coregonus suidteri TaxID=861788 RepID=A0AAN8LLR6_9TELE